MTHHKIQKSSVVTSQLRDDIPDFKSGAVISVHYKIVEGNKERIQIFKGVVIDRHGGNSLDATFTVLKNSTQGIKVERTFPLHSPLIQKIEVETQGVRSRRAYLGFLHNVKDPTKTIRTKSVKVKS